MKQNYTICLLLSALLLIGGLYHPAMGGSFRKLPKERDERARAILEDVAVWFITEGLAEYYKYKDKNIRYSLAYIEKSVRDRGAYLYAETSIDKYGYLAHIVPEYMWVTSTITCYSRIAGSDFIYEYWVVDRFGGHRGDVDTEIYFIIARTKGLDKKREIIHRTSKFFSEFVTPKGVILRFPMDNESIHRLNPWEYPEAFKGTELEGVEIVIENKKYIRKQNK